jgi:pimeloyl-ACP methyl ester carboxylesterase
VATLEALQAVGDAGLIESFVKVLAAGRLHLDVELARVTHVIDGAGHFLHLEQPDTVSKLVVEFAT